MSLINDALRRASQTQKERPHQAATPIGMEAVPVSKKSPLTAILLAVVVLALVLAGWFFKQWWVMRNRMAEAPAVAAVVPASVAPANPPAVRVPAPTPVRRPVAPPAAPVAVPQPAPAPVAAAAPAPVAPPVSQPLPPVPQVAVHESLAVWPSDIKVSAIFFSRTNPRVMISGNMYGVGDDLEGATIKRIGKDKIVLEMSGHTKEYYLQGQ